MWKSKVCWEKIRFFIPLGIQIEIDFHVTNTKINKLHSFRAFTIPDDKNLKHGRRTEEN